MDRTADERSVDVAELVDLLEKQGQVGTVRMASQDLREPKIGSWRKFY